jgi:hypothetical protein
MGRKSKAELENTLELVRLKLGVYEKLERKNTDEIGWIALGMGVTRAQAKALIEKAHRLPELEQLIKL